MEDSKKWNQRIPDCLGITLSLFEIVRQSSGSTHNIPADVLHALHLVLGTPLTPALDLIDDNKVTILSSPSGRWIYQVKGSSGTPYICFPNSTYCQCPAYKFGVLKRQEYIMCKHVIAARLASALSTTKTTEISNEAISDVLINLE
ncbi:zinc finger SWIM domain-containing protein 7-like [Oratosquilla oratoria]|uniref:zinc finger SWIM domain-containing protein 7-like n=1 Tax=Oratosquilla oratoria TaxID=337810 RepID=UPI003F75C2EF